MCRNAWSFSRRPTGRPQIQHYLSQCCPFRPSRTEPTWGWMIEVANAAPDQRVLHARGEIVRSGIWVRASDAPDSVTRLALSSQARHSPALEQCQWSRDTGKVRNQSSIRFRYSCRRNSPVAARLSSPLYDFSSPRDRPIRRPMAGFPFGSGIVVPWTWS